MYPTQLERTLHIPRRVISFHLDSLEEAGLVRSEFGLSQDKRPQAVKYYIATAEGRETYERILNMLERSLTTGLAGS